MTSIGPIPNPRIGEMHPRVSNGFLTFELDTRYTTPVPSSTSLCPSPSTAVSGRPSRARRLAATGATHLLALLPRPSSDVSGTAVPTRLRPE
jgi:hypothetical protein